MQFTVQMSKLNGFGKTHRERKFVVNLNLKIGSYVSVRLSRYEARGKFGGHERCLRVARAVSRASKRLINLLLFSGLWFTTYCRVLQQTKRFNTPINR